jgi:hypothetical protein
MMERDYLMRQIMQLLQALQRIIRFRKQGDDKLAKEEITWFYQSLKIEKDVRSLSVEDLMLLLTVQKKLTNDHLEMVAFVLKEQGEMAADDTERFDFFTKSYFILEKVERESVNFSMDRLIKMGELKEYLDKGQGQGKG